LNHVHAQSGGEVSEAAERSTLTQRRVAPDDHATELWRHVLKEVDGFLAGVLCELID